MPKFLERKLKAEAAAAGKTGRAADRYVFGTMNTIGAMHGNKETPKGARMDAQHRHRMAGSHDGMYVTEHHRGRKK
jgi:hypothetical protein